MPTKNRVAEEHVSAGDTSRMLHAETASPATELPATRAGALGALKVEAGKAKRKSTPTQDLRFAAGEADRADGADAASGAVARPAGAQRIDPAASRKAAAAFVAARRKMTPTGAGAPVSSNNSDAAKGTVPVVDKKVRRAVPDDAAPVAATAMPAPASEAPARPPIPGGAAARPFAAQRGPAMAARVRPPSSAKSQSFKTGEYIVYPAHGVGQITAVETQEVAGHKLELFVISFVKDKMILKVPLPKIASVGMRKLAEPAVMKRALDTLTGRARVKRTMWSRRAQEYEAKINSGDLIAIAEVVRDLYRSDAQPEQSYSERQLYEAALDRMARELGVVQKLTDTEALKLIDDQLQKGPRRGKTEDAEADEAEDGDEGGIGEAA